MSITDGIKAEDAAPVAEQVANEDAPASPSAVKVEDDEAEANGKVEDTSMTDAKEEKDTKDEKKTPEKRVYENGVLKTSAQADKEDYRKNVKFDPSILPVTDDPKEIRGQAEYYFSDAVFPGDDFLWKHVEGSKNTPIPLSVLLRFNRMKRFQPYSAVVAALKDSKVLDIIDGDEEGKEMIKRKVPYDPQTAYVSKPMPRTIYAKGFGDEKPSSQFDIEAYFAKFGSTNYVKLRRTDEKLFKGSVFVEFAEEETATKFLALDPKPTWEGHPLETSTKQAYMDKKNEDIKAGRLQPKESWAPRGRGRGRGGNNFRGRDRNDRGRGGRDGGDHDPDDWKKRREDDRANGFKGDRKGNSRGRGHRGGRNERGGRNNDRRPNDRNRERENKNGSKTDKPKTEASSTEKSADVEKKAESPVNEKKRAREEDGGAEEKPAKKVDTKSEVAATAS